MSAVLQSGFDVLDMKNYRMEKLPVREKSKFEKTLMVIGAPLAIISFVLILFVNIPFLDNLDTSALSSAAKSNFENIGLQNFIFSNKAMLAIFVASLILWITEAIPNYLTSLIIIQINPTNTGKITICIPKD